MPSPRFTDGANYGTSFKYIDTTAVPGQELAIYTPAPENLNHFIDVAAAGLELQEAAAVVVDKSKSKSGNASVRRYPGDKSPFSRKNVARTIMKNRTIRHGNALPGRGFRLQEIGGDEQFRAFTYQGNTTALHSILVAHSKVDLRFINSTGAWELIAKAKEA